MLFMKKCWFYHISWLDCLLSMISLAAKQVKCLALIAFANDNDVATFPQKSIRQESKLHYPASNHWYGFFTENIYALISGHSPSVAIIVELVAGRRKTDEWLERLAQINPFICTCWTNFFIHSFAARRLASWAVDWRVETHRKSCHLRPYTIDRQWFVSRPGFLP